MQQSHKNRFLAGAFITLFAFPAFAQSNAPAFLDGTRNQNLVRFLSVGPSMEPAMPSCKKETFVDPNAQLSVGSIAAFRCTSDTCSHNGKTGRSYVKRVASVEQKNDRTCYTMRGDNKKNSFDSDDYGVVCDGADIAVYGAVVGWNSCQV